MSQFKPAKALNSKKVENSLCRNVFTLINKKYSIISCRALWEDGMSSGISIVGKQTRLDDEISLLSDVEFFFSCVTGTSSNSIYIKTRDTDEHAIFSCLHDSGLMADISFIKTKSGADENEKMLASLKQVLKDHNSSFGKLLVAGSSTTQDVDKGAVLCCKNKNLSSALTRCVENLKFDGLVIKLKGLRVETAEKLVVQPNTGIGKAIETVRLVMAKANHALYYDIIMNSSRLNDILVS